MEARHKNYERKITRDENEASRRFSNFRSRLNERRVFDDNAQEK